MINLDHTASLRWISHGKSFHLSHPLRINKKKITLNPIHCRRMKISSLNFLAPQNPNSRTEQKFKAPRQTISGWQSKNQKLHLFNSPFESCVSCVCLCCMGWAMVMCWSVWTIYGVLVYITFFLYMWHCQMPHSKTVNRSDANYIWDHRNVEEGTIAAHVFAVHIYAGQEVSAVNGVREGRLRREKPRAPSPTRAPPGWWTWHGERYNKNVINLVK